MAVYAVVNIRVTDPDRYAKYREKAPATIARYGGKYLARGGAVEVLEGDRPPYCELRRTGTPIKQALVLVGHEFRLRQVEYRLALR